MGFPFFLNWKASNLRGKALSSHCKLTALPRGRGIPSPLVKWHVAIPQAVCLELRTTSVVKGLSVDNCPRIVAQTGTPLLMSSCLKQQMARTVAL